MIIYLLFANHPTRGKQVIYAHRSKDVAETDRDMLEEVPVKDTTYTVEEVILLEGSL